MSDPYASPASAAPAPISSNFTRRWLPLGIIGVVAVGELVLFSLDAAEIVPPAEAFLARVALLALGGFLLYLWFVFLSGAAGLVRMQVGVLGLVLVAAFTALFRIERVSGDIHVALQWRWKPRADEALPTAASQAKGDASVNLSETAPTDSAQFMGPKGLATFENLHLARDWSQQPPKLLWKQPIGAGWSSFAIVGHYGVTQEQRGDEELITCYDLNDGKLQWAHATPVRFYELAAGIGPRATPTVDEGRVYAMGAKGNVDCLDGASGKVIWQHDIIAESGAKLPIWGKSSSPLVYENLCIVCAGGPEGKSVLAYDKHDGKLVWSAGSDASSYSTPAVLTLCGKPQIVVINEKLTSGHDPADGRTLWEHVWPEGGPASPNVAQPLAVGDDRILLTKGYGVGSTLWKISLVDDKWAVEPVWKNNSLKTKMTSAVVRDEFAYGLDEGTLSCIEVNTGRKKWKRERFGHGQVLLIEDLLLVQSEDGQVALVEASPKGYQEDSRMQMVEGQAWNYPALSGNRLVVRTEQQVACYELPVGSP